MFIQIVFYTIGIADLIASFSATDDTTDIKRLMVGFFLILCGQIHGLSLRRNGHK